MVKVFHGTSLENFKKIVKAKELRANMGGGVNSWTPDCIYFATEFGVAEAHGYGAGADPNWELDGGEPFVVLELDVSEEILLPDYDNNKECKDWKESAKKNFQVCIKHQLDLSLFTKVYLIGGREYNTVVKSNLINWRSDLKKHNLRVPSEE